MSIDVQVSDVSLTLGGNRILDEVSLSAPSGSFVTILGPSGSGKSTTLNLLAGFLKPDSGNITFGGTDVTGVAPGARRLGIVFQHYAIFPHLTVGENVKFPLVAQGIKGDRDKRVAEMLELVKLAGFEKRRASTMSGGQLQRVALARALAAQPQVLLLDEPLSALDKQLREDMQSELKAIQREVGVTTVSVTHDQNEALSMSDQVVVMNAGKIEQQCSPEEMYSKPTSEFLARFLGEVNLLPVDADGCCAMFGIRDREHAGRLLVVRPEDLRIDREGTAQHYFGATVDAVQFQGGSVRLEVIPQHSTISLVVREAYAGYGSAPKRGDTIRIGWKFSFLHSVERAASE